MKKPLTWILGLSLILASAAQAGDFGTAKAQPKGAEDDDPAPAATYDVFIDGVTGYAFVKTPYGWKFVKNLREEPSPEPSVSKR
jgi:hypothetical protein